MLTEIKIVKWHVLYTKYHVIYKQLLSVSGNRLIYMWKNIK